MAPKKKSPSRKSSASRARAAGTPHIMVIDPAMRKPELSAFNWLSTQSRLPLTYHLPALHGMKSLQEEPAGVKGIIILGSLASVNDRANWQIELERWLTPQLEARIPTFGICYGHQMLAYMFGAKVEHCFPDKRKHLGVRQVKLSPDPLWGKKERVGALCVSHCEWVVTSPPEMEVIGRSEEVEIDALRHRKLPIWSFQSHPEAGKDFLGLRGGDQVLKETDLKFGYEILASFLGRVRKGFR